MSCLLSWLFNIPGKHMKEVKVKVQYPGVTAFQVRVTAFQVRVTTVSPFVITMTQCFHLRRYHPSFEDNISLFILTLTKLF